jgi:hypothetical protein
LSTTATSGVIASRAWKLDSSITHASGAGATSSSSSSGRPMLPASAVRLPAARSRCAISALTVLLPLVPVTQIVLSPACSANHRPVPPTKLVPIISASAAGEAYGLMPGDFTTTSNEASLAASGSVSMVRLGSSIAAIAAASSSLQNTVTGCRGSRQRNDASAARPSRP